ncbi:amino acid ABC transporter permease [Deferribacter thermophilus]|uniref:amino acid ABC transporter permease n=1 Tax=Deferribacter thermophilus TaxID=53573 RepID=UPI003C1936F2
MVFRKFMQIVAFLFLVVLFSYLIFKGASNTGYNWQWFRVKRLFFEINEGKFIFGPLLKGLFVTFQISFFSFILTNIFGFIFGIFRTLNSFSARLIGYLYVEIFRNTPLLIQILFFYFVIAPVFNISAFWSAVIAISMFEGAYACEIIRAGIENVDKGQWEASFSLGLNTFKTFIYIILPQAVKTIIYPLINIFVSLIKDSALVSVIAIYDLTMQAQKAISETFMTFEIWIIVAFTYLIINIIITLIIKIFHKKTLRGEK